MVSLAEFYFRLAACEVLGRLPPIGPHVQIAVSW